MQKDAAFYRERRKVITKTEAETKALVLGAFSGKRLQAKTRSTSGDHGAWWWFPLDQALKQEQIRHGGGRFREIIAFDIDAKRAREWVEGRQVPLVPGLMPAYLVESPNGGYHLVYLVDSIDTQNPKSLRFLRDLYRRLRAFHGGDPSFSDAGHRSPFFPGAKVHWFTGVRVLTLKDIKTALIAANIPKLPANVFSSVTDRAHRDADWGTEGRRNHDLYREGCCAVASLKDAEDVDDDAILAILEDINEQFPGGPLPLGEVKAMVTRVRDGGLNQHAVTGGGSERLRERGRNGGQARSFKQTEARLNNLDAIKAQKQSEAAEKWTIVKAMLEDGQTAGAAAEAVGVSRRTVQAWKKTPPTSEFIPVNRDILTTMPEPEPEPEPIIDFVTIPAITVYTVEPETQVHAGEVLSGYRDEVLSEMEFMNALGARAVKRCTLPFWEGMDWWDVPRGKDARARAERRYMKAQEKQDAGLTLTDEDQAALLKCFTITGKPWVKMSQKKTLIPVLK